MTGSLLEKSGGEGGQGGPPGHGADGVKEERLPRLCLTALSTGQGTVVSEGTRENFVTQHMVATGHC